MKTPIEKGEVKMSEREWPKWFEEDAFKEVRKGF